MGSEIKQTTEENMSEVQNKEGQNNSEADKSLPIEVVVGTESVKKTQSGVKDHKLVGRLAMLTKKQTNRYYFSDLPIGTYFIIIEEINIGAYDLLGFFIGVEPNKIGNAVHCTGYVESGSWIELGSIEDNIQVLKDRGNIYTPPQ
jgi:hypothetical protein